MKKNKNLRATFLRDYVGETCIFLGKIIRQSLAVREKDSNELIKTTLINSLYVKLNDEWKYISHAWVELPEELSACKNNVLLFAGEVYDYEHTNGLEDYSIEFKELKICEPWNESYYHGLRMYSMESHDKEKYQRRRVNNNYSIINAYENGMDLDRKHNFKGKKKEFERRKLQTEKICKKEFFIDAQHQLSPIIVPKNEGEIGLKEVVDVSKKKEIKTIDELCDIFSQIYPIVGETVKENCSVNA